MLNGGGTCHGIGVQGCKQPSGTNWAKQHSKQLSNPGFGIRLEVVRGHRDNSAKADLPACEPVTLSNQVEYVLGIHYISLYIMDSRGCGKDEGEKKQTIRKSNTRVEQSSKRG